MDQNDPIWFHDLFCDSYFHYGSNRTRIIKIFHRDHDPISNQDRHYHLKTLEFQNFSFHSNLKFSDWNLIRFDEYRIEWVQNEKRTKRNYNLYN